MEIDCTKMKCEECPINGDVVDVSSEVMRKQGLCITIEKDLINDLPPYRCC